MPFDFSEFLTLAEQLATRADEGSKRTAISRAYYSAYHLAYNRAQRNVGSKPTSQSFHAWCWEQYSSTPNSDCRRLASAGNRMKRLRVKADYQAQDIPRLQDEVERILQDARQFRTNITALDPQYPAPV
jgi:uncharacterized protein (UPF0332 family)